MKLVTALYIAILMVCSVGLAQQPQKLQPGQRLAPVKPQPFMRARVIPEDPAVLRAREERRRQTCPEGFVHVPNGAMAYICDMTRIEAEPILGGRCAQENHLERSGGDSRYVCQMDDNLFSEDYDSVMGMVISADYTGNASCQEGYTRLRFYVEANAICRGDDGPGCRNGHLPGLGIYACVRDEVLQCGEGYHFDRDLSVDGFNHAWIYCVRDRAR